MDIAGHYAALGLRRDASQRAITRRYFRLRLKYNVFRSVLSRSALLRRSDIETAYYVLRNPELRRKYDETVIALESIRLSAKSCEPDFM